MSAPTIEEVSSKYEQTLFIPTTKPLKQIVLCPVGLVGAGKTTVMKPLCEKLSLVRISNDEIRQLIDDRSLYDTYPHEVTKLLTVKYLKLGYSIGIDSNTSPLFHSEQFNELLKRTGSKAVWVHINPPEEFILNKLTNHPPSKLFRSTKEALSSYYRSKENVVTTDIPFFYEFDPSKSDLHTQLDEATKKIYSLSQS